MAEEGANNVFDVKSSSEQVESTDRGIFDFMKKKDDDQKAPEEVIVTEFDQKVHVSESDECKKDEEKKHDGGLLEKLRRSDSSSSSSSDEEGDDEEKRKKKKEKKGLKEKIKEKLPGHKGEHEDTNVPIETCEEKIHVDEVVYSEPSHPVIPPKAEEKEDEEKKGFLDKIKEKMPGQHKKVDDYDVGPTALTPEVEGEGKEKKGFLDKIKEKIPGFHSKNGEEEKKEVKKECE